MNFCGNCGANIPDGSPFCPNCGAPAPSDNGANAQGKKLDIKKLIIAGVAVLLVILLCVLIFSGCGNGAGSPEKVAKQYLKATYDTCDYGDILDLYHKDVIEEMLDDEDYDSESELIDDMNDELEDNMEDREDEYDNLSVDWEIKKVKDADKSTAKYIKNLYDDEYDLEVDEVQEVKYKVTFEFEEDGDDEDYDFDGSIIVVKIGGTWYKAY